MTPENKHKVSDTERSDEKKDVYEKNPLGEVRPQDISREPLKVGDGRRTSSLKSVPAVSSSIKVGVRSVGKMT